MRWMVSKSPKLLIEGRLSLMADNVSDCAQYFARKSANLLVLQESSFYPPNRRPAFSCNVELGAPSVPGASRERRLGPEHCRCAN